MSISAAQKAMRNGEFPQARNLLERLIAKSPGSPELHYNLAMVLTRLNDFACAADHFALCLQHAPENADLMNNLGNALRLSEQYAKSKGVFDRAVALAPKHPALRCNRGWLLMAMGVPQSAEIDFRAALDQDSTIEDAWRGLGDSLLATGKTSDANALLKKALTKFPLSSGLQNSMGVLNIRNRCPAIALGFFKKAVSLNPKNAEALTNLGITAEQLGDLNLAKTSLEQSLVIRPGHHASHFHLAHLATHAPTSSEVSAIESALAAASNDQAKIDLEFALGKSLAKLGEHERAFFYFANARERLYERESFNTAAAIDKLAGWTNYKVTLPVQATPAKVFVVGMPRSGTTLADQILSSHSLVHSLGESGTIGKLSKKMERLGLIGSSSALEENTKAELTTWLRAELSSQGDEQMFVDTSPGHFMHLGLLAELLPEARFVMCTRNAMDNCVSIFEHPLTKAHGYANKLSDLGRYYSACQQLATHWEDQLKDRLHVLNYEKLISDPQQQITQLLQHCGLEFEQACTEFHLHKRAVLTPSAAQVRQPLNSDSVGRWRRYEAFLGELIRELPADQIQPA